MQLAKAIITLASIMFVYGEDAQPQAACDSSLVSISVALVAKTGQSSSDTKVHLLITNNSTRILVHTYPAERGSVQLDVHDLSGAVPPETELGCKRHMSTRCGPNVKLGGPVSFTALVVMPGQTISFDEDVATEYDLDQIKTVTIGALASGFVLVDAPPSVNEAQIEVRRGYLLDYKRYNYCELPTLHSNITRLQINR